MSRVEQRLNDAAAEVRKTTRHLVPPPIDRARRSHRAGWLAFAAAFAVVIIAFGSIPLLIGSEDPLGSPTTAGSLGTPTTSETTDTTPSSTLECSAAGMEPPRPGEGLSPAVANTREAIANAVARCDFETLSALAGPDLMTSFGGGGVENLRLWESQGEVPLATLLKVLDTSHAVLEVANSPSIYVWPAAHAHETWDEIPAAEVEELLGIYTEEELDQFAQFGGYAGWRLGISETGEWLFFVAGD